VSDILFGSARRLPAPEDLPERFSRETAAEWLGISIRTLDRWDRVGQGPRYIRVGKRKECRKSSFLEWHNSHEKAA
jgi:predicted site-specific integrase-resolvase